MNDKGISEDFFIAHVCIKLFFIICFKTGLQRTIRHRSLNYCM